MSSSLRPALHQLGDNLATAICAGSFVHVYDLLAPELASLYNLDNITDFFAEVLADRPLPTGFRVQKGPFTLTEIQEALTKPSKPLLSLDFPSPVLPNFITQGNISGSLLIELEADPEEAEDTGLELSAILTAVIVHEPAFRVGYFWLSLPE